MTDKVDPKDVERKELAAKIANALSRVPNLSQFSRETGIDRRALTRYTSGEIEPSATTLLRIARGLNVSVDQLTGSTEPKLGVASDAQYMESLEASGMQMAQAMQVLASHSSVLIPRLNVRVAAGIGKVNYHDRDDIDQVPISSSLLTRLGIQKRNAYFIQVEGYSMESTIFDRDDVLINAGDTIPKPDGIYAVQYGEEAMLKRIQSIPMLGIISLVSDNESFEPISVKRGEQDQFRIMGRARLVMRVL